MKKMLLLCGTLLLVSASVASAGLSIAWDACLGDGGNPPRLGWCTSNLNNAANAKHLVGSVTLDAPMAQFQGQESYITVSTGATALPAYWGTACAGRPSPFFGVSGNSVCSNDAYAANPGVGGGIAAVNYSTNSVVLDLAFAIPAGSETALATGTEYFMFDVQLNNVGTTNTCAGCTTPASITFSRCDISYLVGGVSTVLTDTQPASPGSNVCYLSPGVDGSRSATWGAVKALYR